MRIKYFAIIILISSVFISCDESFNPKGTYDERYSLNCIIRGDTSFQVATAFKSYDVSSTNPYENKSDSFIDGVFIRMWRGNDEIYIFRDSLMERKDQSRFETDIKYYYINNFVPSAGDALEIEALLPNGRRLISSTIIPDGVKRNNDNSDLMLARTLKDVLKTSWTIKNRDQVFLPKLIINYFKEENGVNIREKRIVPWRKVDVEGKAQYVYPSPSTDYFIEYDLSVIKEVMEDISKDDSDKKKYIMISLTLELSSFDANLSSYYFTVGLDNNSFAIGLDEGDYSNIKNGFGIFGSYFTQEYKIEFEKGYVTKFGYILYE